MPNKDHIAYIEENISFIKEPILIIGSKQYNFDQYNFYVEINRMGLKDITGLDIQHGKGVDFVLDICDSKDIFFNQFSNYYNTIICMETLYAVINPFKAAENIYRVMNKNSILIFSDVFVRRIARMPTDYWRFSYDAHKILFDKLKFDDSKTKISIIRQNKLIDLVYPYPEFLKYSRHPDESLISYLLRKMNRKFFSVGLLNLPRLFPELSIFSISTKVD